MKQYEERASTQDGIDTAEEERLIRRFQVERLDFQTKKVARAEILTTRYTRL